MNENSNFNSSDYEAMKEEIARQYPTGQFVAIQSGQCIEDAKTHRELVEKLTAIGQSPKDLLIVQAGVEYPTSAVIFI